MKFTEEELTAEINKRKKYNEKRRKDALARLDEEELEKQLDKVKKEKEKDGKTQ